MAQLLRERNTVEDQIAAVLGRPVNHGTLGEGIAARVVDISLEVAGNSPAIDGRFASGPLAGRTVNVKFYGRHEGLLDMTTSPALVNPGPGALRRPA